MILYVVRGDVQRTLYQVHGRDAGNYFYSVIVSFLVVLELS